MSVVKFLILNKDKKDDLKKFIFKFNELNPNMEYANEKISCYFCSDDLIEKYVIPQEFNITKDENGVAIINKDNNQLFQMYYYPYVGKEEYFSGVAMSLKPLTKYNFNTEKEYYLKQAAIGTFKKYGSDRLKVALEAAEHGEYNGFTRDYNSREYASRIIPEEFKSIMMDTLDKEKDFENISMADLKGIYCSFIGEQVKKKGFTK